MKILITGFDAFGGEKINPSIETVKRLPDVIAGAEMIRLEIPTVRYKSLDAVEKAIEKYDPDVILSIGQAGGRADISVERIGINVDDFRIPDNERNQAVDEPICPQGPDAYFVKVPVKAMAARIRERNIPASVSNTAGTFVCNHVIYGVCHMIAQRYPKKRSGFIHIPYLPEQTLDKRNMPSMSQEMMVEAVTAAVEAIVESEDSGLISAAKALIASK
ncbi:MAG: pyroglutamyl-peptidase I [Lachnospiraceae bacterium]|nr:pyroglutamyl-peptidase I [Lachnospiraceae bacterium]MCI9204116.1 pyroglutamyl-peptidase I [Lachnospiraceae bacterium]MCI9335490.1 pyroglutamyl-peptidase I [Lachnospiraceae bacterium]